MKIKLEELLRLNNVVYKGAGNNKLIPITQMIGIKLSDNKLTLASTDSFNYLYMTTKVEDTQESINVCVNADLFSKLVSKFTSEFVVLELKENYLLVKGNGEYKLDLLLDDEGKAYQFPVKSCPEDASKQELDLEKFVSMKNYGEKSLAQTMEEPDLIAYFINDKYAITTDRNIMTVINKDYTNIPLTLRSKFVELLVLMKAKINLSTWTNKTTNELNLYVTDGEINLYSKVNGNVSDYPYEAIKNLVDNSVFDLSGKINVKNLLAILDRINLFVTPYDSNVIEININEGKLYISSIKYTGVEVINLENPSANIAWKGRIDVEMLRNQLTSFNKEQIDIYFGQCIKLTEDNVVKLIALVEEQ